MLIPRRRTICALTPAVEVTGRFPNGVDAVTEHRNRAGVAKLRAMPEPRDSWDGVRTEPTGAR
jgi:hypothetical protein